MTFAELSREQKIELKQNMLFEWLDNPSYGEPADADRLVPDEELEKKYGNTEFVPEDFTSSTDNDGFKKVAKPVYAVTMTGASTDTCVMLHSTYENACRRVEKLKEEFGMTDIEEVCTDIIKGYTHNGEMVEIEIHGNLVID